MIFEKYQSYFLLINFFLNIKNKIAVAATQVAFGYGGASATLKSYGVPKGASNNRLQGSASASNGMLSLKQFS